MRVNLIQKGINKRLLLNQFKMKKLIETAVVKLEESLLTLLPIQEVCLRSVKMSFVLHLIRNYFSQK